MASGSLAHPYIYMSGLSSYWRSGDLVELFVERIDNTNSVGLHSRDLVLQLWACPQSFTGGVLSGSLVAEHSLGRLRANHYLSPVQVKVPASLPQSGQYAMVLVVAEWDGIAYSRIHDFHNYPDAEVFVHPQLEGLVKCYCIGNERALIDVARVFNPREPDNLSGTLILQLWGVHHPENPGSMRGHVLAEVTLGCLVGGGQWDNCVYDLAVNPPPAGTYWPIVVLKEWTNGSYITRDYSDFLHPVTYPIEGPADSPRKTKSSGLAASRRGTGIPPVQALIPVSTTTAQRPASGAIPNRPETTLEPSADHRSGIASLAAVIRPPW